MSDALVAKPDDRLPKHLSSTEAGGNSRDASRSCSNLAMASRLMASIWQRKASFSAISDNSISELETTWKQRLSRRVAWAATSSGVK